MPLRPSRRQASPEYNFESGPQCEHGTRENENHEPARLQSYRRHHGRWCERERYHYNKPPHSSHVKNVRDGGVRLRNLRL